MFLEQKLKYFLCHRYIDEDYGWAKRVTTETIQRLLEMETDVPPKEETTAFLEGGWDENQWATTDTWKDSLDSEAAEVNSTAIDTREVVGIKKEGPQQMSLGFLEEEEGGSYNYYNNGVRNATDIIVASEDVAETADLEKTKVHTTVVVPTGIVREASTAELSCLPSALSKEITHDRNASQLGNQQARAMGGQHNSPGRQVTGDPV